MTAQVLITAFCLSIAVLAVWSLTRKKHNRKTREMKKSRPGVTTSSRQITSTQPIADTPVAVEQSPVSEKRAPPEILANFELIRGENLSSSVRADIDAICAVMPEPHPIHRQLAIGLESPEELAEIVASDAGLTASILRNVNSAAFSLASPIVSVRHAITYLGVSMVKALVSQAAVAQRVAPGTNEQEAALSRVWTSSCAASAIAQLLGQEMGVKRPSVLATRALFSNLGDVALVMARPESSSWYTHGIDIVARLSRQQQAFGLNTAMVGAALADRWNLPTDISTAIQRAYIPLESRPEKNPPADEMRRDNVLLYLAGRIADRVSYMGLQDIADLNLRNTTDPDIFYLVNHLDAADLSRVPVLLEDASFRRKANRVVQALAN